MTSTTDKAPQGAGQTANSGYTPRPAFERTLVFIVVFLGLAIVAGLAAVVLRIIYLSSRPVAKEEGSASRVAASASGPAQVTPMAVQLALPPGASVRQMSLDGTRIAVQYDAPQGSGIAVVDLVTGATVARIGLGEAGHGAAAP